MTEVLRELGPQDREQAWSLGTLAFGGDPAEAAQPPPAGSRAWGVLDGDRLLAKASLRTYDQWWGGRAVPMAGVAGVAVHPLARGRGLATRLVRSLLGPMRSVGPISVLFPTAPGIYRPLGWELVGSLDETVLPTSALRDAGEPGQVVVRQAEHADVPALAALWRAHGRGTDGLLTRVGSSFPRGAVHVLSHDVVALAERDGRPVGYLAYDRGRGYGPRSQLSVGELVGSDQAASSALLRSLGAWDAVAGTVLWRGPVEEVGLLVRATMPPPERSQRWMLRVTDAPGAIAARGWPAQLRLEAAFTLVDPDVPAHEGPWQLSVADGVGRLERTHAGPPRLHVRGLALLWSGVAGTAVLQRTGLLEQDVPGLDLLGGRTPCLLDYF